MNKNYKQLLLIFALVVLLLSPFLGSSDFNLKSLLQTTEGNFILLNLRLPRIFFALLAGTALSVSGLVFQTVFRNPLATPYTLGISGGAALGAILSIKFFSSISFFGSFTTTFLAFLGALLILACIKIILKISKQFDAKTILLSGVALNFFFGALILVFQYFSNPTEVFLIIRWLMGNLVVIGFEKPIFLACVTFPAVAVFLWKSKEMNVLLIGEELAKSRGVNVEKLQNLLVVTASVLVGGVVALAGPIGFVGLVVPHVCRLLVGENVAKLLIFSAFSGGIFLLACDTFGRSLISQTELPVGIVTAIIGGPFFLWLLLRKNE
ncbi:iron ABC transporter permease [bacterium]|nr:iron ABC transporter permease [bacterium]